MNQFYLISHVLAMTSYYVQLCDCCMYVQLVRGVEVVLGGGDERLTQSTRERFIPLLLIKYKVSIVINEWVWKVSPDFGSLDQPFHYCTTLYVF